MEGTAPQQTLAALTVKIADTEAEMEAIFRLRYRVFVEEMGIRQLTNPERKERDRFDPHCDHLVLCEQETGRVVGTYRLLPGSRARRFGTGFYSETEFELASFRERADILELGRSCIAPEHRTGRAIQCLWSGIADYLRQDGSSTLIGCASLPFGDSEDVSRVYSFLRSRHAVSDDFGIRPLPGKSVQDLSPVTITGREREIREGLPPLLKGYLRLGARIAGEPALDPVFGTADFLIVMETHRMSEKYRKRFLGS